MMLILLEVHRSDPEILLLEKVPYKAQQPLNEPGFLDISRPLL
jgi:hypothetical protein